MKAAVIVAFESEKTHRQHDRDVNHSEHQTGHGAEQDSRHGTPVQAAVDAGAASKATNSFTV